MSIPPLVCSTPPPPEKCEDDKDHEDFDMSYNLSPDDEDDNNEYNYGNYSSYNIYQEASDSRSDNVEKAKWSANPTNVSKIRGEQKVESEEVLSDINYVTSNELDKSILPKFEENVVEDLNLIVNKDIEHSIDIVSKEFETEVDVNIECGDKQTQIQDEGGTSTPTENINTDISVSKLIDKLNIDENDILDNENKDIEGIHEITLNDVNEISLENDLSLPAINETDNITFSTEVTDIVIESTIAQDAVTQVEETPADDEFGDFEDFQITSTSQSCQVWSVNSENPWESAKDDEGPKFGDFTANFDVRETKSVEDTINTALCEVSDNKTNTPVENENDDFGDFDDFQSSEKAEAIADTNKELSTPDVALWNVNSPDSDLQIVDSINAMLTSIFVDEIPEPEDRLSGKLESCLSITWGHLIDIEVRQPYMISWNNSLGQKTLLKALCIDSRNILFGPKWNYNMPKYAVNLSVAPLQPQKQFSLSSSSNNESAEKVPNKEASAWVDPFTPDGQESCNTENKSVPNATLNRPETSTKLGKIYSSTINVQPVRHINLPDTHIFTPTDSETPRSKTIHYDSGPSSLIPQPVQEINKTEKETTPQINEDIENDYWDFQDFKGSNTVNVVQPTNTIQQQTNTTVASSIPESSIAKTSVTYQTQILQPIKIDPIMPTLNWPDPGEVKETFDDFSDFISSTSWNNEKDSHAVVTLDTEKDIQNNSRKEEILATDKADDEFETFQSAPVSSTVAEFAFGTTSQISYGENPSMKSVTNCDSPSVTVENKNTKKTNSIILDNQSSSTSNYISDMQEFSFPQTTPAVQNVSSDILQPTSASSSGLNRYQHKSDQILQPLSLESYSQINWPNPGIDLQDLSRFNPINSLHSLKSDSSTSGNSKNASPAHNSANAVSNSASDDDIWGDFVSSAPKQQHPTPKKTMFADDDEWTDFVSSPNIKPPNGLNTISFNVHTNLSMQKSASHNLAPRNNQIPLDIPTLNYITPKSSNRGIYSDKHFQNL